MKTRRHLDGKARRSARAVSSVGTSNRRAPSDAPYQAFTLIEILIAVAAFAIVLAAINTIFLHRAAFAEFHDGGD